MASLETNVLELEDYLKNAELDKRFSMAILSGHFLAGDFVDRFLHDQGFDVITIDFAAMDTLKDVDIDTFIENQMLLAQEECSYVTKPAIHWRRFAALEHDNYKYNEKATAWLKQGVQINRHDGETDTNINTNQDTASVFVPIIISGHRDLSMDNREFLNHRYIINQDYLRECTHLHQFNTTHNRNSKKRYEQLQEYFNAQKAQTHTNGDIAKLSI